MYISLHNVMDSPDLVQLKGAYAPPNQKLAVLVFEDADQSLLDTLLAPVRNATPDPETNMGRNREDQVRIFAKQLLTALQYMHHRNIVHSDLRPEAILLQDDHLRLADFGQSRHLLRGKVHGNIQGTPEFVAPEVALGQTVTLAADMWSVGALMYVLLAGISPFLGDNDNETIDNVVNANYSVDVPELSPVSAEAKDFIQKLLLIDYGKRMSVDQALEHDWLSDPSLRDAKLLTDTLREFKYKHTWLDRRVFVQQTPSEHLTQMLEAPQSSVTQAQVSSQPAAVQQAEPYAIYDYKKIKNARPDKPQQIPEIVSSVEAAANALARGTLPKHIQEQILQQLHEKPPYYDARNMPLPPNMPLSQNGQPGFPQLSPKMRPEDFLAALNDPRKIPPFQQQQPAGQLPQQKSPIGERKRLQPQAKGETPSQTGRASPRKSEKQKIDENQPVPPIQLVKGENRDIQYELATRNLSDISEENSIAGSMASLDDIQEIPMKKEGRRNKSRSTTPHADSESTTPLASPSFSVDSADPIQKFFDDRDREVPYIPELNDPNVPIGAPLFLEGLGGKAIVIGASLSPQHRSPSTGTKTNLLSPGQEHSMEVIIATKYGKQRREPGMGDEAEPLSTSDTGDGAKAGARARIRTHMDEEFDRIKQQHQRERDALADLEKYRPKNYYKEDDIEFKRPEISVDDYPWESNYQIGPDTLLLATKGASFNARVRDYRRELWGDGAPFVRQGILGFRNQDITVRERRRFTDLVREDADIAKSVDKIDRELNAKTAGAVRRVRTQHLECTPFSTKKNADGTFAPIFRNRLRDRGFREEAPAVTLDCYVLGNPQPEISWYHQGSLLTEDGKHRIERQGEFCKLTIVNPLYTDGGEYSCVATNNLGTDECSCRILSGDAPARPTRPEVELASDTEAFITWEPPSVATTIDGLVYKLESRPAGEDDHFAPWTVVSENIEAEAVVLKHLNPMGVYQFRITASNAMGWGEHSLTSRIIRTHKRGAPKLNMEMLKADYRLVVLQMPQSVAGRNTGLMEISEELEELENEGADDNASVSSAGTIDPTTLITDDPTRRFKLEKELFRGKFSLVRQAVDPKKGLSCIAKIRSFDPSEFENLSGCQHDNVVQLLAGYKHNNCLLLFTEQLHENVFERFASIDYYTEEQICLTLRQLSSALHWIHFKGIIHMDIQPNNIMFATRRSWLLKLIDFERSISFDKSDSVKRPDPKTLNPEWVAPEMLKSESQISEQVDVWGLGIVAFCLLAGFHPFSSDEDTVDEVRENVQKQKCDPNLIPVQASQESLRFAVWALKKDPIRRMRTDEALSHRFLASDPGMVRRRENIKYASTRLIKTAARTMRRKITQLWDPDVSRYTESRQNGVNGAHLNGFNGPKPNGLMNGNGRHGINEI